MSEEFWKDIGNYTNKNFNIFSGDFYEGDFDGIVKTRATDEKNMFEAFGDDFMSNYKDDKGNNLNVIDVFKNSLEQHDWYKNAETFFVDAAMEAAFNAVDVIGSFAIGDGSAALNKTVQGAIDLFGSGNPGDPATVFQTLVNIGRGKADTLDDINANIFEKYIPSNKYISKDGSGADLNFSKYKSDDKVSKAASNVELAAFTSNEFISAVSIAFSIIDEVKNTTDATLLTSETVDAIGIESTYIDSSKGFIDMINNVNGDSTSVDVIFAKAYIPESKSPESLNTLFNFDYVKSDITEFGKLALASDSLFGNMYDAYIISYDGNIGQLSEAAIKDDSKSLYGINEYSRRSYEYLPARHLEITYESPKLEVRETPIAGTTVKKIVTRNSQSKIGNMKILLDENLEIYNIIMNEAGLSNIYAQTTTGVHEDSVSLTKKFLGLYGHDFSSKTKYHICVKVQSLIEVGKNLFFDPYIGYVDKNVNTFIVYEDVKFLGGSELQFDQNGYSDPHQMDAKFTFKRSYFVNL